MKSYKITSKAYMPINVLIDKNTTLVIPKKGESKTITVDEIPASIKKLVQANVISIQEK